MRYMCLSWKVHDSPTCTHSPHPQVQLTLALQSEPAVPKKPTVILSAVDKAQGELSSTGIAKLKAYLSSMVDKNLSASKGKGTLERLISAMECLSAEVIRLSGLNPDMFKVSEMVVVPGSCTGSSGG